MPAALLVLFHCPCPIVYIEAGQETTFLQAAYKDASRFPARHLAGQETTSLPAAYKDASRSSARRLYFDCFLRATFETDYIPKENGQPCQDY
ncbi:hypothetical protein NDU88_006070 [Pleurodeles waltl]|uniref:Secreted protein n=1 Tax=Pleurodeles waltl TaxID=8319 RepID=A0AAV7UJY2_PLEWA|nr:hypothetical protein NDU88_006070 [Pleurodeles waltl]